MKSILNKYKVLKRLMNILGNNFKKKENNKMKIIKYIMYCQKAINKKNIIDNN